MLVNPLHAAEPRPPMEPSPYLPTSRRFVNPIYLRVERIPEYALLDDKQRGKVDKLRVELKVRLARATAIDREPVLEGEAQGAEDRLLGAAHAGSGGVVRRVPVAARAGG